MGIEYPSLTLQIITRHNYFSSQCFTDMALSTEPAEGPQRCSYSGSSGPRNLDHVEASQALSSDA